MNARHIVIYSHGFGVRKDDRGLFTDIAASLPNAEHIMFDYNQVDDRANTLTVAPLTEQAKKLRQVAAEVEAANPDAVIDLVCHSQGCVVAAIAKPTGLRKTVFTAPPPDVDIEDKIRRWRVRYGTTFTTKGVTYLERKDGSTTIVPPAYWISLKNLDAQELYNTLAENTDLVIITATQDEVLGEVALDKLAPNIKVIEMATGHNFEDKARPKLTRIITAALVMNKQRVIIVNEQDKIIGHKERNTLVKEDIYRVSALWVTDSEGNILLAQRKFTKEHHPGKWGPAVAGTNDKGETYESNIIKEAGEEIGLKDIQPALGPKIRVANEHNHFTQWYTVTVDKPAKDFIVQEDEVEQIEWFTRDELEKELREHPENYLKSLSWALESL
ncbi:MAG TPA: NUDIX domain-containing protein [Candidatus Saccharimonadales bacterium]|nr:NUDIX domain-containing protein [Candidatus Saccharimonadales bacterium]